MADQTQIVDLLFAGRSERSLDRSRHLLSEAVKAAQSWAKSGGGPLAYLLATEALKELALNDLDPARRSGFWKQAIRFLEISEADSSSLIPDGYASLAVDVFQDTLADLELTERKQLLRKAKDRLDVAIKRLLTAPSEAAILLARKSSVLRHQALVEVSDDARIRLLAEAHRCASRGLDFDRTAPGSP